MQSSQETLTEIIDAQGHNEPIQIERLNSVSAQDKFEDALKEIVSLAHTYFELQRMGTRAHNTKDAIIQAMGDITGYNSQNFEKLLGMDFTYAVLKREIKKKYKTIDNYCQQNCVSKSILNRCMKYLASGEIHVNLSKDNALHVITNLCFHIGKSPKELGITERVKALENGL
jgi:hypothetical protein